jgi:hypothetical protein
MLPRSSKPRLEFPESLKVYWPFLGGMFVFHVLVVFVPGFAENRPLLFGFFFVSAFMAMWPSAFGSAPYSFWIFACVYWVLGVVLMVLIKLGVFLMLGLEP